MSVPRAHWERHNLDALTQACGWAEREPAAVNRKLGLPPRLAVSSLRHSLLLLRCPDAWRFLLSELLSAQIDLRAQCNLNQNPSRIKNVCSVTDTDAIKTSRRLEKLFAKDESERRLLSKTYKEHLQFNNRKANNPF